MRAGSFFSASRRRWVAAIGACAWLLYAMAIALAPLPALASPDLPAWATDICSQSHQASPAPEQPDCPHALCCLLGCATHHGTAAAPGAPVASTTAAIESPPFTRTDPARLPGLPSTFLPAPRGPPATVA